MSSAMISINQLSLRPGTTGSSKPTNTPQICISKSRSLSSAFANSAGRVLLSTNTRSCQSVCVKPLVVIARRGGFRDGRKDVRNKPAHLINERIRAPEVRLVDNEKNMLGVVSLQEARQMASDAKKDLVCISPDASPPVCRVMDYTKFKYAQEKKAKETKRKQKSLRVDVKELKMRYNIDKHDFEVKFRAATKFLKAGDKVKFMCQFRGRENDFKHMGREMFLNMAGRLDEVATIEAQPRAMGSTMTMVLTPVVSKADLVEQAAAEEKSNKKSKKKNKENREELVEEPGAETIIG
mmetsp:Transcript_4096/g.4676  ORF Transcript_4096/g.4676 Transcript_4096/m.4676 type:complete len:295 (-) Transcript_4096:111-995(-)